MKICGKIVQLVLYRISKLGNVRKSGPAIRYTFTTANEKQTPVSSWTKNNRCTIYVTHTKAITCSLSIILENAAGIGRKSGKTITEVPGHCGGLVEIRSSDNNRRVVGQWRFTLILVLSPFALSVASVKRNWTFRNIWICTFHYSAVMR